MTGFGRSEAEKNGRKVTVEIKTVNHRFLDINLRIPRALSSSEENIRKYIKERLSRGRVDIFFNYSAELDDTKTASADIALIKSYVEAARKAAGETKLADDLKLSDILSIPDAIIIEETAGDENLQSGLCSEALSRALAALEDMRKREGAELLKNINDCLCELEIQTKIIDSKKGTVSKEYADKMKARISELIGGGDQDEAKFKTEVAYMADRMDISEEVVRLNTHIAQFRNASESQEAVGRKLDFMVQEMNRELNTIGSKSADMVITNAVIEGKSIVERIREQVQNIE